ncbi:unnamed protein product [Caenorhabditis auriculariae]|uniref:LEM domain-containing protein n=1 Tax=Caenorhabditis auriculariae TaxID=2777116 RepID=A0A8S1GYW8_9PELO|nr:unnamed protein product [Caenorhabditis auriculariae]
MDSVSSLTDLELREKLLAYGSKVGPVNATTRSLYEKKLQKILQENEPIEMNLSEDTSEQNYAIDSGKTTPPRRSLSPIPPLNNHSPSLGFTDVNTSPNGAIQQEDVDDYEGEESMRVLSDEELASERSLRKSVKVTKSSSLNWVVITIALLASAVFSFFLVDNTNIIRSPTDVDNSL